MTDSRGSLPAYDRFSRVVMRSGATLAQRTEISFELV